MMIYGPGGSAAALNSVVGILGGHEPMPSSKHSPGRVAHP